MGKINKGVKSIHNYVFIHNICRYVCIIYLSIINAIKTFEILQGHSKSILKETELRVVRMI